MPPSMNGWSKIPTPARSGEKLMRRPRLCGFRTSSRRVPRRLRAASDLVLAVAAREEARAALAFGRRAKRLEVRSDALEYLQPVARSGAKQWRTQKQQFAFSAPGQH